MTEIVREGYDQIAEAFAAWRERIEGDPRDEWRDELAARLPDDARVLELGCGNGVDARVLAERFQVTGVDISAEQISRARAAVPAATFIQADFTEIELPSASFDAVASFYVFNHGAARATCAAPRTHSRVARPRRISARRLRDERYGGLGRRVVGHDDVFQ